jgi:hypothetical protein
MNLQEHLENNAKIEAETKAKELELKYKNSYYKNVDSIRKNIQFFFWVTIIPMVIYGLIFLFNLMPW